jgi:uncharacterized membrane protein
MLRLTASACIDAPVERVWAVLSDLAAIQHWVRAIQHAHCPAQSRGVGAVRICELSQARIEETILEWNEGRSFKYRGVGAPMLAEATNLWSLKAHGDQTLVTSVAEATFKGGILGRALEVLGRPMFSRLARQSLASLKYYVEHGAPFPGRSRDLVPARSAC